MHWDTKPDNRIRRTSPHPPDTLKELLAEVRRMPGTYSSCLVVVVGSVADRGVGRGRRHGDGGMPVRSARSYRLRTSGGVRGCHNKPIDRPLTSWLAVLRAGPQIVLNRR